MHRSRSRRARTAWLFRLRAKSLLLLSATAYGLLSSGLPYALHLYPDLAPLAGLAQAAAPLVALVLSLPLPGALYRAWRERHLVRKLSSIAVLREMSWGELEILMRRVFESRGFCAERVGGNGADGGVDIVLRKGQLVVLVQCKQWKTRQVAVGVVRELLGVIAVEGANGGVVVTCGVFTKDARDLARRANITLIDGMAVLRLAEGVHPVPLGLASRTRNAIAVARAEDRNICPYCGGQMVQRQAKKGVQPGTHFLGCARFPDCRGTHEL